MKSHNQYGESISLSVLSSEELERILARSVQPESGIGAETIEAALQILAERSGSGASQQDVSQHWEDFQTYFNTDDGKKQSLYPCRLPPAQCAARPEGKQRSGRHPFRYVGVVAACIAVLFAFLTFAQAGGLDVYGALGRWTEDVFRFEMKAAASPRYERFKPRNGLQQTLAEEGLPPQLAPSELPADYRLEELKCSDTPGYRDVGAFYLTAEGETVQLIFAQYDDLESMGGINYMKDAGDVEQYECNGRAFYLFSNAERWIAVWSDTKYSILIGAPTRETVLSLMESIPEIE